MGYRVGRQCFGTVQSATDYQMSMVVPTVTADGSLVHPVKQGDTWTYAGQPVVLSFGHCDPAADFAAGAKIAGALILCMATAWGIRFLIGFLSQSTGRDDE